jgi:endonuclease/exonuclease/phosphatase family metal-dependent hydrolase
MQLIAPGLPCVITGDFNDVPGSAPYRTLLAASGPVPGLVDAFRATHPTPRHNEGTHHGFSGTSSGPRIDWIIASGSFRAVESRIIHTNRDGKFPSDHFPVAAVLRPVPAAASVATIR